MGRLAIINRGTAPDDELAGVIEFAYQASEIRAGVAALVQDETRGVGYHGWAHDGRVHGKRKFTGRMRFGVHLWLPPWGSDDLIYGRPDVTGHAGGDGLPHSMTMRTENLAAALARGETHYNRWPITTLADWHETAVFLAAHEFGHIIEYERDRRRTSEVFCETHAARVLDHYRKERSDG